MRKFEISLRRRDIPIEEFIADLKRVASQYGSASLTTRVYDQNGRFGKTTILRRFRSWNKALEAAGLPLNNVLNIPNPDLFENLAEVWRKLGRQPVGKDIDKSTGMSKFSLGTYESRFGSWNKSLVAFSEFINGSEATDAQTQHASRVSDDNVLRGRTPRKINWRLRAQVLVRDSCICRMCGASPAKDPSVELHVDHIRAWSRGGDTVPDNLQTLCAKCNIGKSNETIDGG
jgi:Homing endonuclease associated repeat/HNH endonuclease